MRIFFLKIWFQITAWPGGFWDRQSDPHQIVTVAGAAGDTEALPSTQVTSTQGIIARSPGEILMMNVMTMVTILLMKC